MNTAKCFVDVGFNSLNKKGEELCGDKVEIFQSESRTIIVLADGLGSGVKANILATLTSKIAITMIRKGADIEEVIETIAHTLPVCKVRKIAYSTFSIIEIDENMHCKIFESENPPFFFLRDGKIVKPKQTEVIIMDKTVVMTELQLEENDVIYFCSDGVIHAGVGQMLNFGWEWHHVAKYLERNDKMNASFLSRRLLDACDDLYEGMPGDDTTIVTVKIRKPVQVLLFTGPPLNPSQDKLLVDRFMKVRGKKVVCGGTAANIVARELKKDIETNMDYADISLPPTAKIQGIDLVTEGVLTLKRATELIYAYANRELNVKGLGTDGGSQLFEMLVSNGTHIDFWLGKAMNYAHQDIDFPQELSIKMNVVKELKEALNSIGKIARIRYISEVANENV